MKNTCRPLSRADANSRQRAGRAVAAGAAGLLVVGLERARDRLVADRPHVGLVDAHAERVRGHDDVDLAVHEAPLRLGAHVARQARVVGEHRRAELCGQAAAPAGRTPRASRRRRSPGARPARRAPPRSRGGPPPSSGTGPPRTTGSGGRSPSRRGPGRAARGGRRCRGHLRRRRRGGGDDRLGAEPARGVGQPEVVRPEVVPPLRDAVRLVDDEQADLRLAHALQEARRARSARARRRAAARRRTPPGRPPAGSWRRPAGR